MEITDLCFNELALQIKSKPFLSTKNSTMPDKGACMTGKDMACFLITVKEISVVVNYCVINKSVI